MILEILLLEGWFPNQLFTLGEINNWEDFERLKCVTKERESTRLKGLVFRVAQG